MITLPDEEYNEKFRNAIDFNMATSEAEAQERLNWLSRTRYFMDDTDAWEREQAEEKRT